MIVPDHFRYPIPALGWETGRFSALDQAEVQLGRDRHGPNTDPRAKLPPADAKRLGEREQLDIAHTIRVKGALEKLGRALGA